MTVLAQQIEGLRSVADASDRAVAFPSPSAYQKVWRRDTKVVQEFDGAAWQDIIKGDGASPTFANLTLTGTLTGVNATFSGTLGVTGAATFSGGVTVSSGTTAVQAFTATSGTITGTTSVILTLNTSTGATSDNTQIFFQRGGAIKWRAGTNINGFNDDRWELHNEALGGPAVRFANTTGAATFAAGITATQFTVPSTSSVATDIGPTLAAGTYGFIARGVAGAARDIMLVGMNGFSNGMQVQYDGTRMLYTLLDGIVRINTTVITGAANGDVVLANGAILRGVNNAGTNTVQLIAVNASDQVYLAPAGADIKWGRANIALGGGATATLGTIGGGSAPAAAAQRNWLRFIESDGTASFIPVWR